MHGRDSGAAEERALIIDMIERMIGDLDLLDQKNGREGAEEILSSILAQCHRYEDKAVAAAGWHA
jgi:hypothetical protein